MAGTENRCPSCAAVVSHHDARCPACSQVLGVDNVCERCHALCPTLSRGVRLVCSACGSERTRLPNTVVENAGQEARARSLDTLKVKGYGALAAVIALLGVTLGTLVALYGQNAFEVGGAIALLVMSLVSAILLGRAALGVRARRAAAERFMLEQRVLGFAFQRAGIVTAKEVARHLNTTVDFADAMLDRLVTAQRADMDVTDEGEIVFTFQAARTGVASERAPAARAAQLRAKIESP